MDTYSVHYFNGFPGTDTADPNNDHIQGPDAGTWGQTSGNHPFYLPSPTTAAPAYSYSWRPAGARYQNPTFSKEADGCPIDVYVMAAPEPSVKGSSSTQMPTISQALGTKLFDPTGLALPIDEFVGYYGPFHNSFIQMNTADSIQTETGFLSSDIVDAADGYIICNRSGGTSREPLKISGL